MYLASEEVEPMKRTLYAALLALAVITTAQSQTAKQPSKPVESQPQPAVPTERQRAAQGNVISASAVSGPPLLRAVAVQAARLSTFTPTRRAGQSIKINGMLTYNFASPEKLLQIIDQ